jgi:oxysterol-binding protein
MPNMYARGILFGKMVVELGDTCTVRNDAQDFQADLEFKTRGFFSGTYNAIAGRVKHASTDLGDVSGKWSSLMEFKPAKVSYARTHARPARQPAPAPHVTCLTRVFCVLFYFYIDGGEANVIRRTEERS